MVFAAKYAAPLAVLASAATPAVRRVRDEPVTVFAAPPGYVHLAEVAAVVGGDAVWVWLDEFDDDPLSLCSSVAAGVRRHHETAGPSTDGDLRIEAAGTGWSGVALLAEELADTLAGRPLVLASPARRVADRALGLLIDGLLPAIGSSHTVVVSGEAASWDHKVGVAVVGPDELRVTGAEIEAVAAGLEQVLPVGQVHRAAALAHGRGATLASVLLAGSLLGADVFARALHDVDHLDALLATLIGLSLRGARPDIIGSLQIVRHLGFTHPRLVDATMGHASTIAAPWLLPLEDDWALSDPLWHRALPITLGSTSALSSDALSRLAGALLDEGAPELAAPLCRQAGDVRGLARCLEQIADRPDATHRWHVLERDLYQATLPTSAHPRWSYDALVSPPEVRGWRRLARYLRAHRGTDPPPPPSPEPAPIQPDRPGFPLASAAPVPVTDTPHRERLDDQGPSGCVARLLGSFEFVVDGITIDAWAGTRGRSVLKFLLVHRDRPVRKETLMETFWPGAEPDASRNSLNVAVSSLRRSLRPFVGDVAVVVYQHGAYRFNPALDVTVDVEQFEAASTAGLRLHRAGDLAAATTVLTDAVGLYRGAFFEDDPFEEWTSPTRERLRVLFLDVLDRLGEIAFVQGRYDTCIEVGHKILREDCCREDTHRCLMRCYSRQGRPHLALRQHQQCVESLRRELAVEPSTETDALYEDIRHHRLV